MKDVDDPTKSISHDEIARTKRAMYAMDFFRDPPRATMGEKFNDDCVVPAREEAFQALSEYKAGKPEKLAGLMATGMKEIHNEAMLCEHIYRDGDSDFNSHMTMISGMIGMMKKDPALMEQVKSQLGQEMVENIRDDLRLKEFIDKAENSKRKLEEAGKTNRPLSAEEKKSCMQDIMRAEFADTVRTKAWNEMLEKDEKFMEYAKNEARFIMDIAINKTTLTSEDYAYKKGRLQRDAIKPVFKVTKALRTPEGMQTFENTVGQLTGKMDVGKSEKELLADVNLMRDQLKNGKKAEQKAPVRTAPKKKVTATRQMSN